MRTTVIAESKEAKATGLLLSLISFIPVHDPPHFPPNVGRDVERPVGSLGDPDGSLDRVLRRQQGGGDRETGRERLVARMTQA